MAAYSNYLFNRINKIFINCSYLEQIIIIPLVCCVNATEECLTNKMKITKHMTGGWCEGKSGNEK